MAYCHDTHLIHLLVRALDRIRHACFFLFSLSQEATEAATWVYVYLPNLYIKLWGEDG